MYFELYTNHEATFGFLNDPHKLQDMWTKTTTANYELVLPTCLVYRTTNAGRGASKVFKQELDKAKSEAENIVGGLQNLEIEGYNPQTLSFLFTR